MRKYKLKRKKQYARKDKKTERTDCLSSLENTQPSKHIFNILKCKLFPPNASKQLIIADPALFNYFIGGRGGNRGSATISSKRNEIMR